MMPRLHAWTRIFAFVALAAAVLLPATAGVQTGGYLSLSSFTGVIAPEADLRARSLVNREADGYGLISATLFELGEAGAVVSTEVAV